MSFCQWSSVLECQQGINLAICASALLYELISISSGNEDSSLSEGNISNSSSSSDSTLLSLSSSSVTRSEMTEVSGVDSTSIIDYLLGILAQLHDQMETGMEDNSIYWGKDCLFKI